MASRRETLQRKTNLRDDLRRSCSDGTLVQGELLSPVRELAERYALSVTVVREVLQHLVDDGLLYTVPRVGTFVGRPTAAEPEVYLLLMPENARSGGYYSELRNGFEEGIATLGGTSLVMLIETALECRGAGSLPELAGLFDFAFRPHDPEIAWGRRCGLPRVAFGPWVEDPLESDIVAFDNVAGGRQATEHLLSLGHRSIAFLAGHAISGYPGSLVSSAEREQGWREALVAAQSQPGELAFHPMVTPSQHHPERVEAARATARALVSRPDVTAVVAADTLTARGLFLCLRDLDIPSHRWPSVVSFGNEDDDNNAVVTTLRLPWDEIGRAAAGLLWERSRLRVTGSPVTRRVPMRLIPRLTSRPGWSSTASPAIIAAMVP